MGRHGKPPPGGIPSTVNDDTWFLVTATEAWETTPAADTAANLELN